MRTNQFWAFFSKVLTAMTVTLILASILAPGAGAASKYKVIYNFTGGADGSVPDWGLILDTSGNLYGTTAAGGTSGNGAVFKLTKNSDGSWTETLLYSFAGDADGATPYARVTFDPSGNLYGTTQYGGGYSAGIVFQLVPNSDGTWTENVLYSFTGGSDGANPWAGVTLDAAGTLYGTTTGGGTQSMGVVYNLTPNSNGTWTYDVLHSFAGGNDGSYPWWNLIFDTAGNLWGVAAAGGKTICNTWAGSGCGVIFELTPQSDGSWKEQVIFDFDTHQFLPVGPVIFDSAGRLYGATQGWYGNFGNVFKLTLGAKGNWTEHVLHTFNGNQDGAYPSLLNSSRLRFFGEDVRSGIFEGQSRRGHELGAGQFGVRT